LMLIFIIASLIIGASIWSIGKALEEITSVEEPTSAAAYEMEINIVELSRDVLDYRETGEPQYRERPLLSGPPLPALRGRGRKRRLEGQDHRGPTGGV